MELNIVELQTAHAPKGLVGIGEDDVAQGEVVHLAEELGCVDDRVFHHHVVGVPDGTAALGREIAVGDMAAVDVPPGVFAIEAGVITLDIATELDARLAIGDGDMLEPRVAQTKQRTLAAKFFILNQIHSGYYYLPTKILTFVHLCHDCREFLHRF